MEYVWEQQIWIKGCNKMALTTGCYASRSWWTTLQLAWAQVEWCWLGPLLNVASGCVLLHKFLATGQTQPGYGRWAPCRQFPPTHYPQVNDGPLSKVWSDKFLGCKHPFCLTVPLLNRLCFFKKTVFKNSNG